MGVPAELALLSLELDAEQLAEAGVVRPEAGGGFRTSGVVNRTPFVILVRPGNPEEHPRLRGPGAARDRVVHPDPLTSGGANWAIVAEYGAGARERSAGPRRGPRLLLGIWRNVVAQAASARAARTQFENGFGDALITYEQEVLWDRAPREAQGGDRLSAPHHSVRAHPGRGSTATSGRATGPGGRLREFLWSEEAQRIFVETASAAWTSR